MSERDYGLEISAKAAELSAKLLQIMQQVPFVAASYEAEQRNQALIKAITEAKK